jgi:AcrR family transcriptional regulator
VKTRDKIMNEATKAFNKSGFSAVNLFELANTLGISRGNLTYHFKDKESLLKGISNQMWDKIEKERAKSRQLPSFENLHNEVQLYFKFQKQYSFIFQDPHVLNNQMLRKKFKEMTSHFINDIKAGIAFSISIGNVKEEQFPGTYNNIAFLTWLIAFYWNSKENVCNEISIKDGEKIIWSLMIPHFTDKGMKSFKNFFGEDYFNEISTPFEVNLSNYITF